MSTFGRRAGLGVAIVLGAVLAIFATTPPAPHDAGLRDFSAFRAMDTVRAVAAAPHPSGSPADARVREWLAARLRTLGMVVREDRFTPDPDQVARQIGWGGPTDRPTTMTNIVAVLPGRDPRLPALALMAHHDSVGGSPGAADDGAGLATIVETVRALAAGPRPRRDLVVILTDGEEIALNGATRFFAGAPAPADPLRDHIGALINLEARGGGGRATLFQTAANNGAAIALTAHALARPAGTSLAVYLYRLLPNDTDLTEALPWAERRGVAAWNFAFIGRPQLYHSPRAVPDRLDQGALQDMGDQAIALSRALLDAPDLPHAARDRVFFDGFGLGLVTLPAWSGWVMLALTAGALAVLVRRGGRGAWRAALGGAGRIMALAGLGVLLTMGANLVSVHVGGANYYDRLAANPRIEVMATAAALCALMTIVGRWNPGRAGLAGAIAPLWIMGLGVQWLAPVAAYVIAIPVLAASAIALLGETRAGVSGAALVAGLVVGEIFALGHAVMQGVGSDLPLVIVLPLLLATIVLLPLWHPMSRRTRRIAVMTTGFAGLALALAIRASPIADTVPTYSVIARLAP